MNDSSSHISTEEFTVYEDGLPVTQPKALVKEESYQIQINHLSMVDVQCMPNELDVMGVGFLVSEGLLLSRKELKSVSVDQSARIIHIEGNIPPERLNTVGDKMKVTSGCGRGITIDNIDEVMNCNRPFNLTTTIAASDAMAMGFEFNSIPGLYRDTKCVHSAALYKNGNRIHFSEDIGRHNAVDKVVGRAFMNDEIISDYTLLCTGRFSFDMVAKAARVRIPIIISPAAATRDAIQLAKRFHMTLCGRVRKKSMIVYSSSWRILKKGD